MDNQDEIGIRVTCTLVGQQQEIDQMRGILADLSRDR